MAAKKDLKGMLKADTMGTRTVALTVALTDKKMAAQMVEPTVVLKADKWVAWMADETVAWMAVAMVAQKVDLMVDLMVVQKAVQMVDQMAEQMAEQMAVKMAS